MERDPDQSLEQTTEQLDQRVEKLDEHIDDAKRGAQAKELMGDWDEKDNRGWGNDPVGAHEERSDENDERGPDRDES